MFIGHFALALGAKKYAPEVSLGVLFLASQLADLIWFGPPVSQNEIHAVGSDYFSQRAFGGAPNHCFRVSRVLGDMESQIG